MSDEKTFPEELRDQAALEPAFGLQGFLRQQADQIELAAAEFVMRPTRANKVRLNGLWARGERYMMMSQERPKKDGAA